MADPRYSQWRLEMKHLKDTGTPFPEGQRHNRPEDAPCGFWRQRNARTKADHPIAIWFDGDRLCVKFGNKGEVATGEEVADFFAKGFLKCEAVLRDPDPKYPNIDDWSTALATGSWRDGKPIRMPSAEEKADIIQTGDNSAGEVDLWQQVHDNLDIGAAAIKTIGIIDTLDKANRLAGVIETMSAAGTLGEAERKRLKKPHDDAAAEVQNKWAPMLRDGSAAILNAKSAIQKFKDKEEARLKEEARKAQAAEEERIADEKRKAEAEAQRQAEAMGIQREAKSDDEIAEEAAAEVAEQMPVANTSVRVGTTTGRGITKAKITKGRITDVDAFFGAIKDHQQTIDFLQTIADRLARNGVPVAGLESYKE